jgi:oxepin-CoA hydrolase/3-oxo-5,6-dehydrosuberyl-CoA semialdehyde dehydrogenase
MKLKLCNYVCGEWTRGDGPERKLIHAVTGECIATVQTNGLDFDSIFRYAREKGGPVLRKMTFHERGRMLKTLALHLHKIREKYYPVSYQTGATRADSWYDIEGGIGNLFAYSSLRRKFPDRPYCLDGDTIRLSKENSFSGHHLLVPREGVAVHINAFNFPIWGLLEKISVNLLAGVPAIVKPATQTVFLAEALVRDIVTSEILPEGTLQLICGGGRGILDHVNSQDAVTFTGSATTGQTLKKHERIISESVPFNLEADSLNCSVLGPDADPGTEEFELFVKEVRKEMTIKCGQRCTAIRRILVPQNLLEATQEALGNVLRKTVIGDPALKEVQMGALVGKDQVNEVLDRIRTIAKHAEIISGDIHDFDVKGADINKGAFLPPVLLLQPEPFKYEEVHEVEAFGPVSTLIPYENIAEAIELSKKGKGSLCCSIATNNTDIAKAFVLGAASHHGRILVLNRDAARESTGHGSPMPMLVHGGPGRAGGGEEMGGKFGVRKYMQRCAIQGHPTFLTEITDVYQQGSAYKNTGKHLFQKYFEELEVGETIHTHKRTISESDIVQFANVSWDHFYAHTDVTSLDNTLFEQRVTHGYFILAAAAGLFVDPAKGPVLVNYGIESCRFLKPVYPGSTLGVNLTVKEKIAQEQKEPDEIRKGIVKFLVDVYDETGETVMLGTIMTLVRMAEKKQKSTPN